ncbi:alkyldihydroxyacetonephosphate synthase [Kibdelosporangium banguiense]|uniref:Alkyldihydroxyacetonephosphate synthase n=1 Tax=Kibdelosporangium banguiense TaxID=1365924 RepID=A0ABS4T9K5_9PSEU|nr:FAD-binding oxidoreductase [Kibdelosporangium banguiense]MBP2321106.1 alkyldihydroxyacetonephosphate synthase [Kibdelosporangium banguiense]
MANRTDQLLRAAWTDQSAELPSHALRWLREETGLGHVETPTRALTAPPSELSDKAREVLAGIVGAGNVLTDDAARLGRAGGLSYLDLLKHKGIGTPEVPDAVILPADPDQVTAVLKACAELKVTVVPFGGGTSVVGGVRAEGAVILDLARLDRLVAVDQVSRLATFQAGVRAPDAERELAVYGLTLGHVPQSFERATIGGFAATRSAGQASSGYGRFEDMVEGVRMATPRGDWRLGVAPASAAGPDLKQLVVGSEGAFGVITEVTVRVRLLPKVRRYEGLVFDGWEKGSEAVRKLAQDRVLADVTRLSDVDETGVSFALTGGLKAKALSTYLKARGIKEPCMLILGWEAQDNHELTVRRAETLRRLKGAVRLGRPLGEAWKHGRFNGPRQRDALMNAGVCVETLETATHWSQLTKLRSAVRTALTNALTEGSNKPIVMCHISHAYETGASLYFTAIVPRAVRDPENQWRQAKTAACEAIEGLGTISHHHAVGIDHAPYLAAEIGDLGVDVLKAVKNVLDPEGILNPGKLIP